MKYYIARGEFQRYLTAHYERFGGHLDFLSLVTYCMEHKLLLKERPNIVSGALDDTISDDDFFKLLNQFPVTLDTQWYDNPVPDHIEESDIIPSGKDVLVLFHFQYLKNGMHAHNYFEINYVFKGSCRFCFEKDSRILKEGELCIISPSSIHDVQVLDDAYVVTILLRKSTFNTTFFPLLSQDDLLSIFFRRILYDSTQSNYLLFFTENTNEMKRLLKNLTLENNQYDIYSNNCCISWINLLFSVLLRSYSQTIQFYNYELNSDFSLILQYIKHNYQSVTLNSLATLFHYSEPYLSTLIKKNTGHTLMDLLKILRMTNALHYLLHSDMKIAEIALCIGYHSNDHFSRIFRSYYHMSPQAYRKQHKDTTL